jgi:hypothetical protein
MVLWRQMMARSRSLQRAVFSHSFALAVGMWMRGILERRPARLVTVALANKMARIAWALMTRKEVYRAKGQLVAAMQAAA